MEHSNLVCLGGGHGLGRLLVSLRESGPRLTGIVATTDEGGSTGRLREEAETIAWGDLRNCLSQLCTLDGIGQRLFEYRFQTQGELDGHNLGNLVLFALDQLSIRPTDAIRIMRDMLNIKSHLLPMADSPTTLMAKTIALPDQKANTLVGELSIDGSDEEIDHLYLEPQVMAGPEVITTIAKAHAIILSAGSFMTSIMPSLLVANIRDAINQSSAPLILV
ncbi:MAG: putative cofD-like protein, partial [Oleispira sp.]